jgi:hypothetical protein
MVFGSKSRYSLLKHPNDLNPSNHKSKLGTTKESRNGDKIESKLNQETEIKYDGG